MLQIFEKVFNFTYETWFVTNFLSDLIGPLSFYTALEKTPFSTTFFLFGEGNLLPSPRGRPCNIRDEQSRNNATLTEAPHSTTGNFTVKLYYINSVLFKSKFAFSIVMFVSYSSAIPLYV